MVIARTDTPRDRPPISSFVTEPSIPCLSGVCSFATTRSSALLARGHDRGGFVNAQTKFVGDLASLSAAALDQVMKRQRLAANQHARNGTCVRMEGRSVNKGNRTMRRVISDALISLGAVLLLLVALVSIDDRVRERVEGLVTAPSSSEIAGVGAQIESVSRVMYKAARDQSIDHAPMVIFAVAATVLVLFMLRT